MLSDGDAIIATSPPQTIAMICQLIAMRAAGLTPAASFTTAYLLSAPLHLPTISLQPQLTRELRPRTCVNISSRPRQISAYSAFNILNI